MIGDETSERRDTKRNRMLKGGYIAFSARHATMPCVLRDLSDTGARLQVAQSSAVPDTFELIVELDGLEVPCQVVWRKMTEVGVEFLDAPQHVNPKRAQVVRQTGPIAKATLRRGSIMGGAQAPARAARPEVARREAASLAPAAVPALEVKKPAG